MWKARTQEKILKQNLGQEIMVLAMMVKGWQGAYTWQGTMEELLAEGCYSDLPPLPEALRVKSMEAMELVYANQPRSFLVMGWRNSLAEFHPDTLLPYDRAPHSLDKYEAL